jgi:hypothetical protein
VLARDQLKLIAQEIDRTADRWMHDCDDAFDRQQMWDVVRRASRVIEAVAGLEREGLTVTERSRRLRFVVTELELALDAARRARVAVDWIERHRA